MARRAGKSESGMPPRPLTSATPRKRARGDPVREELIKALMPSFKDGDAGAECSDYDADDPRRLTWPHNVVSLDTIALPSGALALHGAAVEHTADPDELAHCRQLAADVVAALKGLEPFGGDLGGAFQPFYLVRGAGQSPPEGVTPEVVRAAFGGTLFPDVPITVYAIAAGARFTELVAEVYWEEDAPERGGWARFAAWAAADRRLSQTSYVEIGYDDSMEANLAAVFPRLVLGLTEGGSLVGACGHIVQA